MKRERVIQIFSMLMFLAVLFAGCKPNDDSSTPIGGAELKWAVEPTMQFKTAESIIDNFTFESMATEKDRLDTRIPYLQQVTIVQIVSDDGHPVYGLVDYEGKILAQTFLEWEYLYIKEAETGKYILALTCYEYDETDRLLVSPLENDYQPQDLLVACGDGFQGMGGAIHAPVFNFWDEDIKNVTRFSKTDGSIPGPSNSDKISNDTIPVPMLSVRKVTENGQEMYETGNFNDWVYGYALNDKLLVTPAYKIAQHMWEGIAAVSDGEKWYYINEEGEKISEQGYDGEARYDLNTDCANDFSEGLVAVCRDGLWGYMDKNGVEVIPCQYEGALSVYNAKAWVKTGGLWGVADLSAYVSG